MKKLAHVSLAILLMLSLFLGALPAEPVQAAVPIRQTDVLTPSPGNGLMAVSGVFSSPSKAKILDRVNAIREEACRQGIKNPDTGRPLTPQDYVPIKWSSDLEWIAQTRAAEGAIGTTFLAHTRTNGRSCFTATHNGIQSWAEVLAWNWSGMMQGIEQWYSEKSEYEATGVYNSNTGHYISLIKPSYGYIGLGAFVQDAGGWICVAGEFSSIRSGLKEDKIGVTGSCQQMIEVPLSMMQVSLPKKINLKSGESTQLSLTATAYGSEGSIPENIIWQSSDPSVAQITEDGTLMAKAVGNCTITGTYMGMQASATVSSQPSVGTCKAPKLENLKNKRLKITYPAVSKAKGYQIQYSLNKSFKSGVKSVTLSGKTKTLTVNKYKKYYVRVRAYKLDSLNAKVYGKWSTVKGISIKK